LTGRTERQLALFEPEAAADPACCVTCGAEPPPGFAGSWLEPVSGECLDCNHVTVAEIMQTGRSADRAGHAAAWRRHLRGKLPKALRA